MSPDLADADGRAEHGLPTEDQPGPVVIELNGRFSEGLIAARDGFLALYEHEIDASDARRPPTVLSTGLIRIDVSFDELTLLLEVDGRREVSGQYVFRAWPDYRLRPQIDASSRTTKVWSAVRAFDATGAGITWAVVDSGVDAGHPHFAPWSTLEGPVTAWHRDFSSADWSGVGSPLEDGTGHGSHVAGIIAGSLVVPVREELDSAGAGRQGPSVAPPPPLYVLQHDSLQSQLLGTRAATDNAGGYASLLAEHRHEVDTMPITERLTTSQDDPVPFSRRG